MERAWSYLEKLSRYPHRGVGTKEEAAAAAEVAEWLKSLGYHVDLQPFQAPRDTLYLGPVMLMLLFLVAAGLSVFGLSWAGLLLALLALAPLAGEMMGKNLDLDFYLPRVSSQNVIARLPARGDEQKTIVLTAHVDTQHATWLFHPRMVRHISTYLNIAYGSLAFMLLALALRGLFPETPWSMGVLAAAVGLLLAHLIFLLACALTHTFINGANDNGTGTALALALAEHFAQDRLDGVRLHVVITGAEEVGTRGMKQFMRTADYDRNTTYFINLDNLGGGKLHYLEGEGMTVYHRYGPDLVRTAAAMAAERAGAVRAKPNLLLPTDGMIPAAAGYQTISFLAFEEDGSLPNYHWYTDTLENVDRELVAYAERFLVEYVERVAAAPARRIATD
ncbi:MAG: M28 family peptidase [Bacillota bacterium]